MPLRVGGRADAQERVPRTAFRGSGKACYNPGMRTVLSIIGPLIAFSAYVPYLLKTMRGQVRPRIASWATWALVTAIATMAALSQHAYASAFLTGISTIGELVILLMALRKGGHEYTWVDGASQVISVVGIVAWLLSTNATFAILFNILADFFGAVPTFYHAWFAPHDESWEQYTTSGVGAVFSCLAVTSLTFVAAGFPAYLMVMNMILGGMIYFRQQAVPATSATSATSVKAAE